MGDQQRWNLIRIQWPQWLEEQVSSRSAWIQILLLTSCATLNKLLNFSVPLVSSHRNGGSQKHLPPRVVVRRNCLDTGKSPSGVPSMV